jgi:hypothetical protein
MTTGCVHKIKSSIRKKYQFIYKKTLSETCNFTFLEQLRKHAKPGQKNKPYTLKHMKTTRNLLCIAFALTVFSCKKKEEPGPTACISGPESVDRGTSAVYTWCGSDVDSDITWTTSYGETGVSGSFNAYFPSVGKHTITVTGKRNGKTASESIEVNYGTYNKIRCQITSNCFVGNANISDANGCKAYLYNSMAAWSSDVKSGSYQQAIDTTDCNFSSAYSTIYAEFTTTAPAGSKFYIAIEHPLFGTNFGNLCLNTFTVQAANTSNNFGQIILSSGQEMTYTTLDYSSKRLLNGKWKLVYHELNGTSIPIATCNQDDYLTFFTDGTWKYETGTDNCNNTSLPSNGTYPYGSFPLCNSGPSGNLYMYTSSGPFTGINGVEFTTSQIKVSYKDGNNYGFFRFNYSN